MLHQDVTMHYESRIVCKWGTKKRGRQKERNEAHKIDGTECT